jgi:hypothetical protein
MSTSFYPQAELGGVYVPSAETIQQRVIREWRLLLTPEDDARMTDADVLAYAKSCYTKLKAGQKKMP